ncbi:hypothetical protein ACH5RR_037212 [Cinchona calisaya]|uniref:Uncharacterized protein n=1 Tax=Cinchona calisaya TaxID=153742 RepID=A0ABD2Y6S5_9GENT
MIDKVRAIAYKLQLPEGSRIYPVFHISLLKKKISSHQVVSFILPACGEEDSIILVFELVLKRRVILSNQFPVIQWLNHWKNLLVEKASWEGMNFIPKKFPHFQP